MLFREQFVLNISSLCYLKFQYISDEVVNKIKTNKN